MRFANSIFPIGLLVATGSLSACSGKPGDGAETLAQATSTCSAADPFICAPRATPNWVASFEPRTVDGTGNNPFNPTWGATNQPMLRTASVGYADGVSAPARPNAPSPRAISNALSAQPGDLPNDVNASNFIWQWGQFIDHDMDLTGGATPAEPLKIAVPTGDPQFDPKSTGTVTMGFSRSAYAAGSGVRQQTNRITAFIDASNVYGSDTVRATTLRANDGTGRLLTSSGNELPLNSFGLENANAGPSPATALFVAGDIRSNEQVGLTAMHTLFMREHNRVAGVLHADFPTFTDEQIYQAARAIVGAEAQRITYYEFLPTLLGPYALAPYQGYDSTIDPTVENMFAHSAFRVGHTLLSTNLLMLGRSGQTLADLSLRTAFFVPDQIIRGGGIDPLLRGLAARKAQQVDAYLVDDVRNFLFGPPGAGGLDLASLNLQRGRDHGLPSYNDARQDYGLPRAQAFTDISSDPVVAANFASAYASVDDVDPWIGGIAEDHVAGAMVGALNYAVLVDQFTRLRDGDRFYYEAALPQYLVEWVNKQSLAKVIRRNTSIGNEMHDDCFHAP